MRYDGVQQRETVSPVPFRVRETGVLRSKKLRKKTAEQIVEAAWERYFRSVPGTPEAIEYLRRAVSMPLVPEYFKHAQTTSVREPE